MLPQLGISGGVPAPRKLRIASMITAEAQTKVACTIRGAKVFGRMCRIRMLGSLVPTEIAASTPAWAEQVTGVPAAQIGPRHDDAPIEAPGSQQRGIQYVGSVGGRNNDHAFIFLKPVHFNEQLVKRLFAFIITAAKPGATMATNGVNFVDKDDTRGVLFGLLEHVAHAAGADTDKHFDEI